MPRDDLADRLAGTTWTARDLPLADAIDVVRAAGLRAVEIWAEGVHLDPRAGGYRRPAVSRALGQDLQVVSVHLPFHDISEGAPAEMKSRDWVRLCTETLHRAAALGARIAVAHPVIHRDPGEPEQLAADRLTVALHRLAGAAEVAGLRLAVENMHELRGPTLRSVGEILHALGDTAPSVGVCLDTGHAVFNGYTGERLGDEIRTAGGRLLSTHVHDSDRIGADPHLPPGEGIVDWPVFLNALAATGYTGRFVLEVDGGPDPVGSLETARSRFTSLLRRGAGV